jgi:hypothetical protein
MKHLQTCRVVDLEFLFDNRLQIDGLRATIQTGVGALPPVSSTRPELGQPNPSRTGWQQTILGWKKWWGRGFAGEGMIGLHRLASCCNPLALGPVHKS